MTTGQATFGGMTQQDRDWFAVYESANPVQAGDLTAAFDAMVIVMQVTGYTCPMDDRADKLRAAIARYMVERQQ